MLSHARMMIKVVGYRIGQDYPEWPVSLMLKVLGIYSVEGNLKPHQTVLRAFHPFDDAYILSAIRRVLLES